MRRSQRAFLLCAGDGARWNNFLGAPKHFLEFGGEALVERARRLAKNAGIEDLRCVIRAGARRPTGFRCLTVTKTESLAETILATGSEWVSQNLILLGDVFYSPDAIASIVRADSDLTFLGRPGPSAIVRCGHGEMFAMRFNSNAVHRVRSVTSRAMELRALGAPANLWNVYQLAGDLRLGASDIVPGLLNVIDDYTNDIDTPVDYERRSAIYRDIAAIEAAASQ